MNNGESEVDQKHFIAETNATLQRDGWKSLLAFTQRSHLLTLLPAVALSTVDGFVAPAVAIYLGKFFDAFSSYGQGQINDDTLMHQTLDDVYVLIGIGTVNLILKGVSFSAWLAFGELQAKSVRDELFRSLLEKDLEWYDSRSSGVGTLLTRLQTQIRELQLGTSQPLGFVVNLIVQGFASLGLALYYDWNLTLIILSGVPFTALAMAIISRGMQHNITRQQKELIKASEIVNYVVSNIVTIKCCNTQDQECRAYTRTIRDAAGYYVRQASTAALRIGVSQFATTAMFVAGFWYGGYLVHSHHTTSGKVVTTFWAALSAIQSFTGILPHYVVLEKGIGAAGALRTVLDRIGRGRRKALSSQTITPTFCEGDIEIRDVTFAYPSRPEQLILKDATFFFPAGETTFLVGRSGSGKSTISNILLRFYPPMKGQVFMDGFPVESIDIDWLRNNITLVQQESVLFNETIARNIALGRQEYLGVDEAQIVDCISFAALTDTVAGLPQGINTAVGSGGSALSGGQKQRVAIARARLRDAPVLILDESTSALDPVSRRSVMDKIRAWRKEKTTIIITHDMTQIGKNDFVYVLEGGSVIGEGYRRDLTHALEADVASPVSPTSPDADPFGIYTQQTGEEKLVRPVLQRRDSIDKDLDLFNTRAMQASVRRSDTTLSRTFSRRVSEGATALMESFQPQPLTRFKSLYMPQVPLPTMNKPLTGILEDVDEVSSHAYNNQIPESLATFRPMSMHQAIAMHSLYSPPQPELQSNLRRFPSLKQSARELSHDQRRTPETDHEVQWTMKAVLRTVWRHVDARYRTMLVIGLLAAAGHAAVPPTFSYLLVQLFATFALQRDYATKALIYSLAIIGIAVLDGVCSYLMRILLEAVGQRWVDGVRIEAFRHILAQPKAWYDQQDDLSTLVFTLDRNAEEMRNLLGRFMAMLLIVVVMMLIAIIWSFVICWKITLVALATAPALYLITKMFETVSSKFESAVNTANEHVSAVFAETFTDIRTVRALTQEPYFHKKYTQAAGQAFLIGMKRAGYSGFFFGLSDTAVNYVTALIFYTGTRVAVSHEFSIQAILEAFALILFSTASANSMVAFIPQISSSLDTAGRLLSLANLDTESHENWGTVQLDRLNPTTLSGPISFLNQTFHYPARPETAVLRRLRLDIPAGQCTAIVGSSGCGKSTIASLLLGLYPASESPQPATTTTKTSPSPTSTPTLTLSGTDISTLSLPSLRALIAFVPQHPVLFPKSVRANIIYGLDLNSALTTTSNIVAAATAAGIHDFITTLPQGYDTLIGEGGLGVSGGQAQRIVIARALVRQPRILILDEATSALDRESARVVRRSIRALVRNGAAVRNGAIASDGKGKTEGEGLGKAGHTTTVIMITHDRVMMRFADYVAVMDEGQVVEDGTYKALMGRRGKLWEMLSGGGEE